MSLKTKSRSPYVSQKMRNAAERILKIGKDFLEHLRFYADKLILVANAD